jgi:hypothetical protein
MTRMSRGADQAGALPRTPPRGFAPWNPTKRRALGTHS